MSKILLVEDDNNLREIYEARLMAEGYTIVTAPDGEAALAIASQEKPDLVISDVMMPNISGFDMLDIMRNTNGLKNVHVIMLTALSQAEDQARADALGADRYLVKSQVTLEDIVNNAKVLLGDVEPEAPAVPAFETTPMAVAEPVAVAPAPVAVEPTPVAMAPEPVAAPQPVAVAPEPTPVAVAPEPVYQPAPIPQPQPVTQPTPYAQPEPATIPEPTVAPQPVTEPAAVAQPAPVSIPEPVVQPQPEPVAVPEPVTTPEPTPVPANPDAVPQPSDGLTAVSTADEQATMRAQIEQFINQPEPQPATPEPASVAPTSDGMVINPAVPTDPAPAAVQPTAEPIVEQPQPPAPPVAQVAPEAPQPVAQPQVINLAQQTPAQPAPTVVEPTPAPLTANEQHDAALNKAVDQLTAAAQTNAPAPQFKSAVGGNKVIQPISNPTPGPDIHQLLAQEEAREQGQGQVIAPQPPQTGPRPEDIAL